MINSDRSLVNSITLSRLLASNEEEIDIYAVPYSEQRQSRRDLDASHSSTASCKSRVLLTGTDLSRSNTNRSNMSLILRIISGIKDERQMDNRDYVSQPQGLVDSSGLLMHEHLSKNHSRFLDIELPLLELKEESTNDEKSHRSDGEDADDAEPPDGGYAWVIAFCAMISVLSTWGTNSAFGVFLNYYLSSNKFEGASEFDFALIGGITVFIPQFIAPLLALLYKMFGYKRVCYTGVVIQTAGFILASFATKLWQLYCTQAVLVGISFSLIYIPTTLTLPTWFRKRLATAMGIAVSGAGLGGVVFSLAINKMIHVTGDQRWALRMCGIVNFFLCVVATTIVHPYKGKHLSCKQTCTRKFVLANTKLILSLSFFHEPALVVAAFWYGMIMMGYVMVLFSVPSVATLLGLSRTQGSNLIVVLSAAQVVGRPMMGYFADSFGRINISASFSLILTVLVLGLWMNVSSYGALIAALVLLGLTVGVGSSLSQLVASVVLDRAPQKLSSAWSWFNILVSLLQLVLEVIALALRRPQSSRPYLYAQVFGGSTFFAAFISIMGVREYIVRRNFLRRLDAAITKLSGRRLVGDAQYENLEIEDREILELRVERYEQLLKRKCYLVRMFYPSIV